MPLEPLDIFRPGTFTSMEGDELSFSDADIRAMAEAYDPELSEAPLVVGHPKANHPAYGWVASLSLTDDGHLLADPHQVHAEFADMVANHHFKKKSASFFSPTHPSNPVPGVYYLRHVGFLGAQPPAVKGLRDASVSLASDDDFITIDFSEPEADMPTPEELAAREQDIHARETSFADRESGLTDREQQIADREAALAAKEAAEHLKDINSFAEQLLDEGQVLPRDKDGLVAFMASLDAASTIEFADGDATRKPATGEWLRQFLTGLPKQVDFAERGAPEGDAALVSFAAPAGTTVDAGRLELHRKAVAYQTEHKCDYVTAVRAVGG